MPRLSQRILVSLATLLVAAHAHAFEAGWMQMQVCWYDTGCAYDNGRFVLPNVGSAANHRGHGTIQA